MGRLIFITAILALLGFVFVDRSEAVISAPVGVTHAANLGVKMNEVSKAMPTVATATSVKTRMVPAPGKRGYEVLQHNFHVGLVKAGLRVIDFSYADGVARIQDQAKEFSWVSRTGDCIFKLIFARQTRAYKQTVTCN